MLQNRCDIHTHTIFSRHAYSTVRENVLAARDGAPTGEHPGTYVRR